MVGWHHWLDGHEFEKNSVSWWWTGTPGVLQSMGSQKSDITEQLNWPTANQYHIWWRCWFPAAKNYNLKLYTIWHNTFKDTVLKKITINLEIPQARQSLKRQRQLLLPSIVYSLIQGSFPTWDDKKYNKGLVLRTQTLQYYKVIGLQLK